MQLPNTICLIIIGLFAGYPSFLLAGVEIKTDPQTRLKSYRLQQGGFKLELVQRLPDQTRAFFMARGFSKKIANDIALSCVFQTIGTNISDKTNPAAIEVSLKDWRLKVNNKEKKVKLKTAWDKQWSETEVNKASRIAFKWATFPSYQNFSNSGDYGWGMTSFNLPPQTVFDLKIVWTQNKKPQHAWIRSIECPEDR